MESDAYQSSASTSSRPSGASVTPPASSTSASELSVDSESLSSSASVTDSVPGRLHCPASSELARRRKVSVNLPRRQKRSRGGAFCDPKSVSPPDQVKQYPQ